MRASVSPASPMGWQGRDGTAWDASQPAALPVSLSSSYSCLRNRQNHPKQKQHSAPLPSISPATASGRGCLVLGGAQSSLDRRPALYAAGHGSLRAASRAGGVFVGTGLRTPGFCSAEAEGTEGWGASPCCPGGVTLGGAAERGPRLG